MSEKHTVISDHPHTYRYFIGSKEILNCMMIHMKINPRFL